MALSVEVLYHQFTVYLTRQYIQLLGKKVSFPYDYEEIFATK